MKDRLLTLALAIGALAAFYVLLAPKPSVPQERVTRPLSTEAGPNGYLGLQRWLTGEGLEVVSLRERYGSLAGVTPGATSGNLLISTSPQVYPLRTSEAEPLRSWIEAGNTLLVLAGLSDTPEWSMGEGADGDFMDHMETMTGLRFTAIPVAPGKPAADTTTQDAVLTVTRLIQPQRVESTPNGAHPLLDGVQSILAVSEFPSSRWQASSNRSVVLELASDHDSGVPALWLLPYGDGQIIVSAYGSIFTNKVLGERDNARLLANIARWSLGDQGRVIIDDAHQGLVSFYDPAKFFGDSRLHRTLWWLLALWLVFVLGPRRLRGSTRAWNPLDVTSFVRATGGFMARVLRPAAAGQRLFANFFNEIRGRLGQACDGAPLWEWLAGHSVIPAADLERLQQLHRRVADRRRVDLVELHTLIARVRALLN
ncbi:MAG TPA: DUF4350 domain-containing protein [Steroidobacteraceae bacterium]|nr:DUF4350 domain-containing protein [Steroidobacteraceae bacterium]